MKSINIQPPFKQQFIRIFNNNQARSLKKSRLTLENGKQSNKHTNLIKWAFIEAQRKTSGPHVFHKRTHHQQRSMLEEQRKTKYFHERLHHRRVDAGRTTKTVMLSWET